MVSAVARWILGCVFIYMGLSKGLHPEQFLKLVHQYELTSNPLVLNSIAAALPWFEVFCGTLLVLGVAVRGTALVCVLMLVPFTVLVVKRGLALAAAQGVPFTAIQFDCGCGGGPQVIWRKALENSALILMACWLVAGYGRKLCLRYGLLDDRQPAAARGPSDSNQGLHAVGASGRKPDSPAGA
jgi:uncharacterized membrane protein YphA (DoxX/SURF4 family)